MIVERIIKFARRKGYDDYYAADLLDSYDANIALFGGVLQFCIWVLGRSLNIWPNIENLIITGQFITLMILIGSIVPYFIIKYNKKVGNIEHERIAYMIASVISSLFLMIIRYAPFVSIVTLIIRFFVTGSKHGYSQNVWIVSGIGLGALAVFSFIYHMIMSRLIKETRYYVDWKINQTVGHFDESISRSEKWRRPSNDLDFEKQDEYRYRNLQVAAFVGALIGAFSAFIFTISFIPMKNPFEASKHIKQIEQKVKSPNETNTNKDDVKMYNSTNNLLEEQDASNLTEYSSTEEFEGEENVRDTPYNTSSSFHQSAVINDPDGYTNVRSAPNLNSDIVKEVYDEEVFFYEPSPDAKWVIIYEDETSSTPIGYMSSSRVKKIASASRSGGSNSGYNTVLSKRKLSVSDLDGKTKKELEIMRNSIYARYGYKFKREDLLNHFSQYSWYNPSTRDMTSVYNQMSSIEKYNVEFIKKHE